MCNINMVLKQHLGPINQYFVGSNFLFIKVPLAFANFLQKVFRKKDHEISFKILLKICENEGQILTIFTHYFCTILYVIKIQLTCGAC